MTLNLHFIMWMKSAMPEAQTESARPRKLRMMGSMKVAIPRTKQER